LYINIINNIKQPTVNTACQLPKLRFEFLFHPILKCYAQIICIVMKRISYILGLFFIVSATSLFSQNVWTIGPMVHINFGNEKSHISYSLECAYWNISHVPYSVDAGIEYEPHKFRLYSELQTGIEVTGIGLGPVLELNTEKNELHLGLQNTLWINCFLGIDYRQRWINHTKYYCTGLYGKLPVVYDSENIFDASSNSNTNNTTSSHHHHGDWD